MRQAKPKLLAEAVIGAPWRSWANGDTNLWDGSRHAQSWRAEDQALLLSNFMTGTVGPQESGLWMLGIQCRTSAGKPDPILMGQKPFCCPPATRRLPDPSGCSSLGPMGTWAGSLPESTWAPLGMCE